MVRVEGNNNKSVYGIEKTLINGKTLLRWKSVGLSDFIVISSSSKEDVLITDDNKDAFARAMEHISNELLGERVARVLESNTMFYIVSLDELKRDGGLQIKNMPSFFAVYGIINENNNLTVHYETKPYASNIFSMTIDVVIRDEEVFTEKHGLFKRGKEYSGYHRVTLSTPYPTLVGGVLKYNVDGFSYPFPDEIVENGGSFYVSADINLDFSFESSNQGIIIK